MQIDELLKKARNFEFLTVEEGAYLYRNAPTADLMFVANELRKEQKPDDKVTWIIDRNVNTTNICIANCKFCNFFVPPGHEEGYITTIEQYKEKIEELFRCGGEQLLLQGGHHPELGLSFYTDLFRELKSLYPRLKLHALGPPEVAHICEVDDISYREALQALIEAGLDTLPGAGAEILVDRVRKKIAQGKCLSKEWLDVMREAHQLGITTSATMMFGHIETIEERMEHLARIRQVQSEKPEGENGFKAFIPWPYQDDGTILKKVKGVENRTSGDEYMRLIALSRIMLPNIENIQASWLTVGKKVGQMCLHGGANDFGSIMIEENVVSAAGADYWMTADGIQHAIQEAGFEPQLRNQKYEYKSLPENIKQQEERITTH